MCSSKQFHAALLRGQCGSIPLLRDAAMYAYCAQSSTSTTTLCSSQSQQYLSCGKEEWQTSIGMKCPHLMPSSCGVSGTLHHTRVVLAPNGASGDNDSETTGKREEKRKSRWTLDSTIKEVLFEGEGQAPNMKLNDFLRSELAGRGVVEENENLAMAAFVMKPDKYIKNEEVRGDIMGLPSFQTHVILCNALFTLQQEDMHSLRQWSEYNGKEKINLLAKGKLDAALYTVQKVEKEKKEALEGLYESVYGAEWSHVVEVPGGEGMRMEIRGGEPQESWTFKEDGLNLQISESVDQFSPPRCRLMVLASEKKWSYSLFKEKNTSDCYVNTEVERVWRVVQGDLRGWFENKNPAKDLSMARVLIGTPGIGKSMAAGPYLLYQLLHCERLPVVVCCFGESAVVFDKTTKRVTEYKGKFNIKHAMVNMSFQGMKGYIIYDTGKEYAIPPSEWMVRTKWGMIVLSSPNENNFKEWKKVTRAKQIIINCPQKNDVKAICAWMNQGKPAEEQLKEWELIEGRMDYIVPIPRGLVANDKYFKAHKEGFNKAVRKIAPSNAEKYFGVNKEDVWTSNDPSHKLVKLCRKDDKDGSEYPYNTPISSVAGSEITAALAKARKSPEYLKLLLLPTDLLVSTNLERWSVAVFLHGEYVERISKKT